ncbi:unnamed protein product [Trichobilharzia regenti]|nr:unnamed protein product [Trichobilharzia regenti]
MAVDAVQNVENYIRDIAKDRKCRFSENFLDFDNLRSGRVTGFPGPKDISDEEIMALVQRYRSLTSPGFVDYMAFERDLRMVDSNEKLSVEGIPPTVCLQLNFLYLAFWNV